MMATGQSFILLSVSEDLGASKHNPRCAQKKGGRRLPYRYGSAFSVTPITVRDYKQFATDRHYHLVATKKARSVVALGGRRV